LAGSQQKITLAKNLGLFKFKVTIKIFKNNRIPAHILHIIQAVNPDIIFAGTRPAALFRSSDGGLHWQKLAADIGRP
jgi:hypothetical protein